MATFILPELEEHPSAFHPLKKSGQYKIFKTILAFKCSHFLCKVLIAFPLRYCIRAKFFNFTFQLPKMKDTVQQEIRLSLLQMALDNAVTIEDYEECQQLLELKLSEESQNQLAATMAEAK